MTLGYRREVWHPEPGAALTFDDPYRLAHLPLIAADHPLAVAEAPGRPYRLGRHPPITSVVLAVDHAALDRSEAFRDLTGRIAASRFASKICWPLLERRRHRLHATVAGALSASDLARITGPSGRDALADIGAVTVEVRGLFTGRINRGRIYLRAYPEEQDGRPAFARVHDILDRPPTDLFLVGLYNLRDELDPTEAEALRDLVADWWDRPILRFTADRLALLSARDDLVLDSEIVGHVDLTGGRL